AKGHGDTSWGIGKVEALAARVKTLDVAVPEVRSPLDGRELMNHFGREPGPWIGAVKDRLKEMVLEGELAVDDKPAAWTLADRIAAES
ncbi:MAG TPA: hypothetical protein VG815_21270, partial [Chloroflexota bacterium]|nr:hypothetical protein [Chloroflexota bacterium]